MASKKKVEFVETDGFWPICPHCQNEIKEILTQNKGLIPNHVIYMCPRCKMILAIGMSYL